MKKAITYVATAILLGLAVIILPKALEPQQVTPGILMPEPENQPPRFLSGESLQEGIAGIASQPNNLPPLTLVLLTGIIAALGVYTIFKRRITTQPAI